VALRQILRLVADALRVRLEEGPAAPKSIRTLDVAFRKASTSLTDAHIGLFWNVVPEGFVARDQLVWGADASSALGAAKTYEQGVRMIGLLPGLKKSEFAEVVRLLGDDIAPFSDFATFLHGQQLEHVVFRVDPTKPGMRQHESVAMEPSLVSSVSVMLAALRESEDGALRVTLLARLERWGEGHEAELGEALETAGAELAIGLLRVLSVLDTAIARDAIDKAARNPHPIVRIVALTYRGAGTALETAVRSMLDVEDPPARFDALVSIEKYKIAAAAPVLAERIREPSFHTLPIEERRQALSALGALAPSHAEALAIELLREQRHPAPGEHEATREVALELLASIGESPDARTALETAIRQAEKNDRARNAAIVALASFDARANLAVDEKGA
jgi:hypothetical protein